MAKVSFRLNKGLKDKDFTGKKESLNDLNPDKPYPIYLRYRSGKIDFNTSIGYSILPAHWDFDKKKAIDKVIVKNHVKINSLITKLKDHFDEWDIENNRKGFIPNYNEVKRHYLSYSTKTVVEEAPALGLFELIDLFIEQSKELKRKKVSQGTVKTYMTTKEVLKGFEKVYGKLTFDNIDLDFYFAFVEYCEKKKKFTRNYIGKNIKTIKTFMAYALEHNLTQNRAFKSKHFVKLNEEADNVYLTEEELERMWQLDLSKDERKERARDLFLIGAYTGLRVSDFNNLRKHNIKKVKDVELIKVPTQKTGAEIAVPLHPIVKAILVKRNGAPPKTMQPQTINYLIKEIAESAGIDSVEYISQTKGGITVELKKYKFELIKTHTARRSFCSNAYLSGMAPIDIMAISGHSTEKEFLNYIKLSNEDLAIKMSKNDFFTGKLKVV